MIEKIKYAIFDMDGTLIDSLGYWGYFWQKFGEKYFGTRDFKVDEDIDKQIRTITLKDASELLYERYKPDNSSADDILALANGMIEEHYGTRVSAKRGAVELLRYLKERGVKMCVASATEPRYVKYALEVQGIYDLFEFTVSCNEVGAGKDKPDVFLEAMKRLGGNLAESCVFEDSFIALETAKKAGFMTSIIIAGIDLRRRMIFTWKKERACSPWRKTRSYDLLSYNPKPKGTYFCELYRKNASPFYL